MKSWGAAPIVLLEAYVTAMHLFSHSPKKFHRVKYGNGQLNFQRWLRERYKRPASSLAIIVTSANETTQGPFFKKSSRTQIKS